MKKLTVLALLSIIVSALVGCNTNKKPQDDWETYNENFVYNTPRYEPIDVAREGAAPNSIVLTGIPEEGIPQTRWDDYPIKLRCFYSDGEQIDYDFKVENIPISLRHKLGEVGTHTFEIGFDPMPRTWEFKIIENPNWKGFNCYFFDGNNKLVHTQTAGYYESITYNGPEIAPIDELYSQYQFTKWNRSTDYICQNIQFKAQYKNVEKRDYARKPIKYNHHGINSIDDIAQQKGSTILYLGRLYRVAGLYSDVKELDHDDITLRLPNTDFAPYWNNMNKVAQDHIKYVEDPAYTSYFLGSVNNMISNLNYNTIMDRRYRYPTNMELDLEDNVHITVTTNDPYDNILNKVTPYMDKEEIVSKDHTSGYYRLAVLFDVDVFITYSYRRIGPDTYELDAFNDLTISPVLNSCYYEMQYSEDGEYKDSFDTCFTLDTQVLWWYAHSHNWGEWVD